MTAISTRPHHERAFPGYGALDFDLPIGFEDAPSRKEGCPSFMCPQLDVQIYAEHRDPAMREHPEGQRFTLLETIDGRHGSSAVVLAHSDSYDVILAAIEDRAASMQPRPC